MTETLTAPLPYHGGKQRLALWLAERLPVRGGYGEPFCGMAAVLLQRPVSRSEWINDLDRNVHAFWTTVRDDSDHLWLAEHLRRAPLSAKGYLEDAQQYLTDPDLPTRERALHWMTVINGSFGGMVGSGFARRWPQSTPPQVVEHRSPVRSASARGG